MTTTLTHADLVAVAERWLWGGDRACQVVLREYVTSGCEIPDVIGFGSPTRGTIVVECKTTRADFRSDQQKISRRMPADMALGTHRYYLAPKGLLVPDDVPAPWGLLATPRERVTVVKPAQRVDQGTTGLRAEARILTSALHRLARRGHLPAVYVPPWNNSTAKWVYPYCRPGENGDYQVWDAAWQAVQRGPRVLAEWLEHQMGSAVDPERS